MSPQKNVHNRIHTLRCVPVKLPSKLPPTLISRGEQFRHLQNLRGSRSHLTSTNIHTVPSLPLRLLSLADPSLNLTNNDRTSPSPPPKSTTSPNADDSHPDGTSFRPPAGPTPPKSWRLNTSKDIRESATWRAEALSLVFSQLRGQSQDPDPSSSHLPSASSNVYDRDEKTYQYVTPRIPPLSLLCLQLFLTTCTTSEFRDEIVPYIPSHLRKDLIRFTAIHSPLSSARLYALWEPYGHTDGEIIVVGPGAVLKDNHFIRSYSGAGITPPSEHDDTASTQEEDWDWDVEDTDTNPPLTVLILLNTSLASSTVFSFPPTLTHLALINLSTPVPIHRLPSICPLLVVLDISYNTWLGANFSGDGEGRSIVGVLGEPQQPRDPTIKAVVDMGRVDWLRWSHLKVLGFRGNYVPEDLVSTVNEGRWDDVDVTL